MFGRMLLLPGLLVAGLMAGCSTTPRDVAFPIDTADRNLTYCNSQTLDLYIPHAAVKLLFRLQYTSTEEE